MESLTLIPKYSSIRRYGKNFVLRNNGCYFHAMCFFLYYIVPLAFWNLDICALVAHQPNSSFLASHNHAQNKIRAHVKHISIAAPQTSPCRAQLLKSAPQISPCRAQLLKPAPVVLSSSNQPLSCSAPQISPCHSHFFLLPVPC